MGLPDSEVEKLLNFFTFLPQGVIQETMKQHIQTTEKRIAQHLLAKEFVELVHGPEEAEAAQTSHLNRSPSARGWGDLTADLEMVPDEVLDQPVAFVLHASGLADSRSKANKLVESGGAYIIDVMGHAVKVEKGQVVTEEDLVWKDNEPFLVLRAGKWKTRTISITE